MKLVKSLVLVFMLSFMQLGAQNWDIELLRNINQNRNKQLDNTFRGISNSVTPISISTPIILYGVSFLKKDTLMRQKSVYIGVTVVTAATISTILKYSINRTRPYDKYSDIDNQSSSTSPSFPSGHTSHAFALATSLSIAYPKWYIVVPSYTWAASVAYSRLALSVHYPSDVLAGAIVGAGSAYLCYKAQQWLYKKHKPRKYKF